MTSAVYLIMLCGSTIAVIAERPVDGRYVSMAYVEGIKISDEKLYWVMQGMEEAEKNGQVFQLEREKDCVGA